MAAAPVGCTWARDQLSPLGVNHRRRRRSPPGSGCFLALRAIGGLPRSTGENPPLLAMAPPTVLVLFRACSFRPSARRPGHRREPRRPPATPVFHLPRPLRGPAGGLPRQATADLFFILVPSCFLFFRRSDVDSAACRLLEKKGEEQKRKEEDDQERDICRHHRSLGQQLW